MFQIPIQIQIVFYRTICIFIDYFNKLYVSSIDNGQAEPSWDKSKIKFSIIEVERR